MDELYNPFPKLPKNIRQIGERDEIVKLYVEDYVNTYLKRLFPVTGQRLRVGLLLGSMELSDGTPYIFIDGALEMEDVTEEGLKVSFTELSWKRASQNMDQLFPKRSIQGWFICGSPGEDLSPLNYWKQHMQYFGGPNKLMYLSCGTEGDETIYVTSEDGFYKLQGYSIYYERNQMMQDYMVLRKDVKRIETDTNDKVIEEFRKRMGENKEEAVDRHQTVGLLRGMCMAMSVVVLAGGIVMFNNYERMKSMESVVVSAIPAKAEKILLGDKTQQKGEKKESGVVVEEADGEVYPTSAVSKETMSETMPGATQAQTAAQAGETAGETVSETAAAAESEPATQKVVEEKVTQAAKPETQPATQAAVTDSQRIHTVVEGETLYGICIAEYKSVNKLKEICELNGLEDENKIVAGQKLRLP
ncbi:MAG: LysM peptidoglycan-binding domain-containing protein [Paenibacillaceae bacterium]|nr:LysM peptidoglycan-binding domain-containing protein [Paenibacillaceae bacterium]